MAIDNSYCPSVTTSATIDIIYYIIIICLGFICLNTTLCRERILYFLIDLQIYRAFSFYPFSKRFFNFVSYLDNKFINSLKFPC